jgi:hypothetical protein
VSKKRSWWEWWGLLGGVLAGGAVIGAIAVILVIQPTSEGGSSSATTSTPSPSQTIAVTIPDNPDKSTSGPPSPPGPPTTVTVAIPDPVFEKLGPPRDTKWLTAPRATLIAAGFTILGALIALFGVLRQVGSKAFDDRLDDLWQRFTWVVGLDWDEILDWNQRVEILKMLKTKAQGMGEGDLVAIIDNWAAERMKDALAAARSDKADRQQPRSSHPGFNEMLTNATPAEAAQIVIALANLLENKDVPPNDMKRKAASILQQGEQKLEQDFRKGAAPQGGRSSNPHIDRLRTNRLHVTSRRSQGPALSQAELARLFQRLLKRQRTP